MFRPLMLTPLDASLILECSGRPTVLLKVGLMGGGCWEFLFRDPHLISLFHFVM